MKLRLAQPEEATALTQIIDGAYQAYRDQGIELHLLCGNHDFWAGRFLREDLGIHVHEVSVDLPFGDMTARLIHGDGVTRLLEPFAD